ncbi:MAG: Stp1/IreP family PP2C-type Ser/Thr phosphatase [Desulfobacteraceae bacterium]|nr:Stp1/IreP family PP2C-type Ser/Thr phosphatase [Desulfobacteraceae bacterium]
MTLPNAKLEVAALSETGYVRSENQDHMSGFVIPSGHLYIVADGMGGHKGGAVAAEMTVNGLQQYIGSAPADASVEDVIRSAFEKVNQIVYHQAHSGKAEIQGMGSTAVLLLVAGRIARVAHVGDSRAYLYRKKRLIQLTTDHTMVQKMVEKGMLSPQETFNHPNSNILERAIGSKPHVEADISDELMLDDGDAVILCSDGLTGYVTDAEILRVLRSRATVQDIPKRLVNLALDKGGEDNVTVQFIQYGSRKEAGGNSRGVLGKKFRKGMLFLLLILFTGAALFAGKNYLSMESRLADTRTLLEKTQQAALRSRADAEALRTKLQSVLLERDKSAGLSQNYKHRLKTAGNQVHKVEKELSGIRVTLEKTQQAVLQSKADVEALRKQLQSVQMERDKARSDAASCKQKIADMEAKAALKRGSSRPGDFAE